MIAAQLVLRHYVQTCQVSLSVWDLPFDQSNTKGTASSCNSPGIALSVIRSWKPFRHDKVGPEKGSWMSLFWGISQLNGRRLEFLLPWAFSILSVVLLHIIWCIYRFSQRCLWRWRDYTASCSWRQSFSVHNVTFVSCFQQCTQYRTFKHV
jgi:hypothetical protein